MKFFTFIILQIIIFTCDVKSQDRKFIEGKEAIDSCINVDLNKQITDYILKIKGFFPLFESEKQKEKVFFSLHFFEKNNLNYFTIWTDYHSPSICDEYHYYSYDKKDFIIIFILKKGAKNELINKECMVENLEWLDSQIIYDGSLYPRTYIYRIIKGKCEIEKSNNVIFDFYKDYPIDYFKKLEYPVNL